MRPLGSSGRDVDARAFRATVKGSGDAHGGVPVEIAISARGVRVDRVVARGRGNGVEEHVVSLAKFPWTSVLGASWERDEIAIACVANGAARDVCARAESSADAEALGRIVRARARGMRERREGESPSTSGSLVRDLREENALLAEALRSAEDALARAARGEGETVDLDDGNVGREIKIASLRKNLEYEQSRCARLREDVEEQRGKLERYRALEDVMGRENEALRRDLRSAKEERDKATRRAEASEVMAAHAKNEIAAIEGGRVADSELSKENVELKRELAIANSAKSTAEEHLKLTLAHLRAARDENVRLTSELLKKTEESVNMQARCDELEQLIEGSTLRESTQSKELTIAVQERNDAINRVKIFEKDVKRLNGEVERLVGKLGDAERAALREKEEIRAECAERVQEYAMQISKHTASARDAAIEAQKQGNLAHNVHMAKQELEYELHEERRQRMALQRQLECMEAAKQTIADFAADAEATVLRSIEAQREASMEVQRLRMEKHDLKDVASPKSTSPKSASQTEPWRAQLGAALELHRTIRGSPVTPTTQSRASWSRVTDLTGGAAFSRVPRPVPSSAQRLEEIQSEIAIIKQRQTPGKPTSLESKFNLQNGPRVTTVNEDVLAGPVA
ncbi:Domain of unknown function DUF3641 [Ostreococcus tauri]|uniref:Uncharacterized protein n=1 Tax=Ostreococcus tauri TaxID=70448 RepID=A0A096P7A4_OSTTA|nr:Domain of unknown function DUF3641 [Ostreococcus tauri]CEF97052.1 Domain of unknown function DUF3641 [Ostreococcus tauri]|eukprot:XP_003078059.2 Domain of unknown function DUF3641 [Ostreococcus tauri]